MARQGIESSQAPDPLAVDPADLRERALTVVAGLAAVALLGVIDHVTGPELGLSIIYLAPVGVVTWLAGRGPGLFVCLVAAVVWGFVDRYNGIPMSHPLIPVWNSLVRLGFFAITAWLIADVRRMHARERFFARVDGLTGVANARAFLEVLEHELARMRRAAGPLTLAYVDLDRFKAVNDSLGHSAGDRLLREVAARLVASVRAVDVVARLGGDEFALLLPDTDSAAGGVVLARCHEAIRAAVRETPGVPDGVGATIGAVVFQHAPPSAEAAVRAADDRMYRAKRDGTRPGVAGGPEPPGTTAPS